MAHDDPKSEHEDEMEIISDSMSNTLADDVVLDGLDQMIHDIEHEFLDVRNLKRLEKMRNDAKTPLYRGSNLSKIGGWFDAVGDEIEQWFV